MVHFFPLVLKKAFFPVNLPYDLWLKFVNFHSKGIFLSAVFTACGYSPLRPSYNCRLRLKVKASFTYAVKNRYFPRNTCGIVSFDYSFILVSR